MELRVKRTSNQIEDISIAYGLCSILEYNCIDYILTDRKSVYLIETEDFDVEELIVEELDAKEYSNYVCSLSNLGELTKDLVSLNSFLKENLTNIFKYYEGDKSISFDTTKAKGIGNTFYTLSKSRDNIKPLKIPMINRQLSTLGWIKSCSYCLTKEGKETTSILLPTKTNQIVRPYIFTYIDKETGKLHIKKNLNKTTNIVANALEYLQTLKGLKKLPETEYKEIVFTRVTKSGNKPLPNKTEIIKNQELSIELIDELLRVIDRYKADEEIKTDCSMFALNIKTYNYFSKLIRTLSKNNKLGTNQDKIKNVRLNEEVKGEILNMYDEKIKRIYNNESIKKLGNYGLKKLLKDNIGEGFIVQNRLYSATNSRIILECIRRLLNAFKKQYNKVLLNNEELTEIINMLDDKDSRIIADVILAESCVFTKMNKEEIETEENEE